MEDALYYLKAARTELLQAKRWGMADLIGLPAANLGKYRHLERAAQMVENARPALRKLGERVDGPEWGKVLPFADWFLDGPVADLCAGEKIREALNELEGAIRRLEGMEA